MLDIKNKASLAINKFIDDAISASPDLKDKLDNIHLFHLILVLLI